MRGNRGNGAGRWFRQLSTILVVGLVVAACGAPTGPAGDPGSGGGPTGGGAPTGDVVRFYPQSIVDPMADGITAFTFLAPESWDYTGSVQWLPEWTRAAFLQTRLSDPVSQVTIEWLPIQDFIWFEALPGFEAPIGGNYQGKQYVPPVTDPAQFVTDFWIPNALSHLSGAQIVSIQEVPAIADEFVRGFGGPANAAAYRIRYAYDADGRSWNEDVSFALLYSGTPELTSWYVNFAYRVRAPAGELDARAGTISTVVASRETTPQWDATYRLVQQLFTQGIQQQMADTVAFGQTLAQHRAELQALQDQVTQERQASQDRIADLRGQTLQGIGTYDDPAGGGAVQLPVGFNDYWVNDRGEYLAAGTGFDPNTLNDGAWRRLQPRD